MMAYHDEEWGVPIHDDRRWYEKLLLDGAQAGLSWSTILRKREGYRKAFAGFDPAKVARFTDKDVTRLMGDAGIVRNRLRFAPRSATPALSWRCRTNTARSTPGSGALSAASRSGGTSGGGGTSSRARPIRRALPRARGRGYNFVGSTILYAFMQAGGLVNDHVVGCFRRLAGGGARRRETRRALGRRKGGRRGGETRKQASPIVRS